MFKVSFVITEIQFPTSVTFCCFFPNCRIFHRNILSGMANPCEQFVLQSIMCSNTDFHFLCIFCSFRIVILIESWFFRYTHSVNCAVCAVSVNFPDRFTFYVYHFATVFALCITDVWPHALYRKTVNTCIK